MIKIKTRGIDHERNGLGVGVFLYYSFARPSLFSKGMKRKVKHMCVGARRDIQFYVRFVNEV